MADKKVSEKVCNARFKSISDDVSEIKDDLKLIKNNHLPHINNALTENSTKMKMLGYIGGASLGGLITLIVSIVLLIMNGGI